LNLQLRLRYCIVPSKPGLVGYHKLKVADDIELWCVNVMRLAFQEFTFSQVKEKDVAESGVCLNTARLVLRL